MKLLKTEFENSRCVRRIRAARGKLIFTLDGGPAVELDFRSICRSKRIGTQLHFCLRGDSPTEHTIGNLVLTLYEGPLVKLNFKDVPTAKRANEQLSKDLGAVEVKDAADVLNVLKPDDEADFWKREKPVRR